MTGREREKPALWGTVLRYENSSIYDGPGLRTVVFLKGCPLACSWCSTPESQSPRPERGWRAGRCGGCGSCLQACPEQALSFVDDRLTTDRARCRDCHICVSACPNSAIPLYGQTVTAEQAAERACRDSLMFFHSGGGVTLSGGEPLFQAEFSGDILRRCQQLGVHTAMESCLYASRGQLEQVLPWLDLLYADIKHMDPAAHARLTGRDNRLILDNLLYIRRLRPELPIVVRLPVIPGLNDSPDNVLAACAFCQDQAHIDAMELLPFHKLGLETYRVLGRDYACADTAPPGAEAMASLKELCRSRYPKLKIS